MKKKLTIVKIGGNIINDTKKLEVFLEDFAKLQENKILVHGGGKKASELIQNLGLSPKMIKGRRVTDIKTLEIVTMVYAGLINKNIVAILQKNHCNALGISGADAGTIKAHKRIVKEIDYGFVGNIDTINTKSIECFLEEKIAPVFCAITHNQKGQLLNTNADTIASCMAIAMAKKHDVSLIYIFEKKGVLKNINNEKSIFEHIDKITYEQLKKEKIIVEGMLPKLENCFNALQEGVQKVHLGKPDLIKDLQQKHTILTL